MLTIGAFSKICQVSVKTLHHYDRIGLLTPKKVDAVTGYRYYDQAQLERMLLIGRLKHYGMSLEEIRLFLDCGDDRVRLMTLRRQAHILEQQQHALSLIGQELAAHVENFERTGDIMDYQKHYNVTLVTAPSIAVCASRQTMGVAEFGTYYSNIFERIAKAHLTPTGLTGAMYFDEVFNHEASDIELFVGIQETEQADKVIGGQRCAMTVHKGAYSTLSDAYAALVVWIENNGYAWNGAPFELYRKTQFDTLQPEEWETEIYFPVREQ